jgi:hypothetical protein
MAQYYSPYQHLDGYLYNENQGITYIKSSLMVFLHGGENIQLQSPTVVTPVSFYEAINVISDPNQLADHWWIGECLIPVINGSLYNPGTTPPSNKVPIVRLAINQKLSYNNANYFCVVAEVFTINGNTGGQSTNTISSGGNIEIL